MLIQVRGANGAGKGEVMRRFVKSIGGFETFTPHYVEKRKRPLYLTRDDLKLAIVGHYETQCGEANLSPFSRIAEIVVDLYGMGCRVLLESMLMSVEKKQTLIMRDAVPDVRLIFLVTSVEQCVANIHHRREVTQSHRLGTKLDVERIGANRDHMMKLREYLSGVGVTCVPANVDQAVRIMRRWLEIG